MSVGAVGSLLRQYWSVSQITRLCSSQVCLPKKPDIFPAVQNNTHEHDWSDVMGLIKADEERSVLRTVTEPLQDEITPYMSPTFNFAAYVNKSPSLQQLIKLGVDLSKLEKKKGIPQFVLKLDFERDMKDHLTFLHDIGVPAEAMGRFVTKNPLIFKENLDDLRTRVNYLLAKRFEPAQVTRIADKNPHWLMFNTQRIDRRLGFFQKNFDLRGTDVRYLATKQPRLITYRLEHVRKSTFSIKEEMGFTSDETRVLLLKKPKLWMINHSDLIERFEFVHRTMAIPLEQILKEPEVLNSREFRLQQRHLFLKHLNRAQYDSKKDLYVSLKSLVGGTDTEFVLNVAKSSVKLYDQFLRTL